MSKLSELLGRLGGRPEPGTEELPVLIPEPRVRHARADLGRLVQWAVYGVTGVTGRLESAEAELRFAGPDCHLQPTTLTRAEWISFVGHVRGSAGLQQYRSAATGQFTLSIRPPPNTVDLVVDARFEPDAHDQVLTLGLRLVRPAELAWGPARPVMAGVGRLEEFLRRAHGAERVEVEFNGLGAQLQRTYSFGTFDDTLGLDAWEGLMAEVRAMGEHDVVAFEARVEHDGGTTHVRVRATRHAPGPTLRASFVLDWQA